ncbi:MAG: NADPH:quinone reductase [Cytophagaceae bacterium]|nr:NADPH:quinone reductase [Cytophagaceae bacterium]|tara:strand:+ start:10747 stop:11748 length:1002 start_codon:yes stop_codon:yes gene_type:complete
MSPHKTRIVRFHETGPADVLQLEEIDMPVPQRGEVRIQVKAIGLNRSEVSFRNGNYLERAQLPSTIGYECSGTIDALGEDVEGFKLGDRVSTIPAFSMTNYGVYGETAIVPVHAVSHYPESLSYEEATSIWMQYLTAYGALVGHGKIDKTSTVIITAASSSVGHAAIEIIRAMGATSIATTRTQEKKQHLLDAGADHVIVTDDENLQDRVKDITDGKGATLAFDPVAGSIIKDLAGSLAKGGTLIIYGKLAPETTPFPLFNLLKNGLTFRGYTLFEFTSDPHKLKEARDWIYSALANGKLKPTVDRTFTLDEIVQAHEYMESNQQKGKIVVTV